MKVPFMQKLVKSMLKEYQVPLFYKKTDKESLCQFFKLSEEVLLLFRRRGF